MMATASEVRTAAARPQASRPGCDDSLVPFPEASRRLGRSPDTLRLWHDSGEGGRPVVATAVITSPLGVLVGRRRDGVPPWTFPGGKIESGESPEDAAVREALEETGIAVRATGVIGSRIHPVTGVAITYVAAVPVSEAETQIAHACASCGDRELAGVRWVSLAEADELLPGMFGPVHEHLRRAAAT